MANIIAVVWDFDKTLVNGYMEEHHFQLQCSGDLLHGLCEDCAKNSDF